MNTDPSARLLAVIDAGSAASVIEAAAAQAGRRSLDLDLLACVTPPPDLHAAAEIAGAGPEALIEALLDNRRREIEAVLPAGLKDRLTVRCGKTFIEIIREAAARPTAMVVKAAEPLGGPLSRLFASTDQHLLRKCPCPVWLRAPEAGPEVTRVLAAVDVDPEADEPETLADLNARVLDTAIAMAEPDGVVHVAHAWQADAEGLYWAFGSSGEDAGQRYAAAVKAGRKRGLDALLAPYREAAGGPDLSAHLLRGAPHAVIPDLARRVRADLLVMGTVARTGLRGVIIGNTAENILNAAAGSVVAVKPSGFVTPIVV
ncbi:MAG: universal stress protein [Oceanicaulis sp.]